MKKILFSLVISFLVIFSVLCGCIKQDNSNSEGDKNIDDNDDIINEALDIVTVVGKKLKII